MPPTLLNDPQSSLSSADATVHLLTRTAEHLDTRTESLLRALQTDGLTHETLVHAGGVLSLCELAAAEARYLTTVLLEESSRDG